jgi:hypothetical protein
MTSNDTTAAIASMRTLVRTQLQDILYCGPDEIGDDVPFGEMGLDSVLGVELLAEVNRSHGLDEKVKVLYRFPTVNELTPYLVRRAGGEQESAS